jgi:quercetin dioxygenase-like cupin family protein
MRHSSLALGIVLGACAGTAATTIADSPAEEPVAAEPTLQAEVRKASHVKSRWVPSGKAHIELLAQGNNAFVGMLYMDAGGGVPEHADKTEEYIHVIEGGGVITIDGADHTIAAGDTIFMPAGATVSYANGESDFVGLQVFADPSPASKYDKWLDARPPTPVER